MRNEAIALDDLIRPIHDEERNLALLKQFLRGRRFKLDCAHFSTPCHNLANTMVILPDRNPKFLCHECYD